MPKKKLALMQIREVNGRILKSAEVPLSSVAVWKKLGYSKVREIEVDEPVARPTPKPEPKKDENAGNSGKPGFDDGEEVKKDDFGDLKDVKPGTAELLRKAGFDSFAKLKTATDEELLDVQGIGGATLERIRDALDALED
jgi:ERCC4-type nuclease